MKTQHQATFFGQYKLELVVLAIFTVLGVTAAFTSQHPTLTSPSNQIATTEADLKEQNQNFVFFYTKKFLDRNTASITVPFSYKTEKAPIIFLGFTIDPQKTKVQTASLISHPQLNELDWQSIKQDGIFLYQRQPQYKSVQDFIDNPPDFSRIIVDDLISEKHTKFKGVGNTENPFNIDDFDYILTTFSGLKNQDGILYANVKLNIDNAVINEAGDISWFLRAPQITEDKPYLLGNINVDFIK